MVPVTATLQGTCTVQLHYNTVSYSEGVQVATCEHWIHLEEKKQAIYVKVASFKEFTAENAVRQYMHISTHTVRTCEISMSLPHGKMERSWRFS